MCDLAINFDETCLEAFNKLKEKLIYAPIIVLMCDAGDYVIDVVINQLINKTFHTIYYARKTLNES